MENIQSTHQFQPCVIKILILKNILTVINEDKRFGCVQTLLSAVINARHGYSDALPEARAKSPKSSPWEAQTYVTHKALLLQLSSSWVNKINSRSSLFILRWPRLSPYQTFLCS